MKMQKAARKRYGRFFYRFPNGESAADVYDRITGNLLFRYPVVSPWAGSSVDSPEMASKIGLADS